MTTQPAIGPRAEPELPRVYRIPCPFGDGGVVHLYYIDAPEPALIDAGVKGSAGEAIAPALAAAGFDLAGLRHLFNTHGHWDHMGGNEQARRLAKSARVYLHENDRHLMERVEAHTEGYSSYAVRLLRVPDGLAQVDRLQRSAIDAPTSVDVFVTDGQRISLGGSKTVRAIHIPGHSRGSTAYLLEEAGILFTGDGIQGLGSRKGQLPLVFDDSQAYRASIAKVSALNIEALCLGHAMAGLFAEAGSGPVRRGSEARTFLEESGEAAKAVEEASRSVIQDNSQISFDDFARKVYARLQGQLGIEVDQDGMNARSMATAHAFYRELTGAPLPA